MKSGQLLTFQVRALEFRKLLESLHRPQSLVCVLNSMGSQYTILQLCFQHSLPELPHQQLNHNAGISSKNVTLGVPRLNEVINVARTIKTPSLKIFVDPSISKDEKEVYKLGAQIEYTNLSHLISDWGIYYDPDPTTTII